MAERARGFDSRAGIAREATLYGPLWPSASAAAITQTLPLEGETVVPRDERVAIPTADSGIFNEPSQVELSQVGGGLDLRLTYNQLEYLFAAAFGFYPRRDPSGAQQPEELVSGQVYRHRMQLAQELGVEPWKCNDGFLAGDGLLAGERRATRFTYGIAKGDEIWEVKSCVATRLAFDFQAGRGLRLRASILGHSLDRNSTINTDICGLPKVRDYNGLFKHCKFRLAPQSDTTPLATADRIKITQLSLEFGGAVDVFGTGDTGEFIDEPAWRDVRTVSGDFTAPDYFGGSVIQNYADAGTVLMGDIVLTGPQIGTTGVNRSITFYLPHVVLFDSDASVRGEERVRPTYSLEIAASSADVAGMPTGHHGYRHVICDIVSDSSAHPLLD